MFGDRASSATAGSFWWFCGVKPGGLPELTLAADWAKAPVVKTNTAEIAARDARVGFLIFTLL
jgi:hypothetical protein